MRLHSLKRVFVGTPLPTAQSRHERLDKATALAVFVSDALSSVAYATEEILLVLVLAGTVALSYSLPIGVAIAILVAIVTSSYRQTIRAYPRGGGAYIVTKDNLGTTPALTAGAALLIDYVLTVAVSVAAGVAAVTSAVPALFPYRVWLAVPQRQGGVRGDGPRPDAPAGGEVGQVGYGAAPDQLREKGGENHMVTIVLPEFIPARWWQQLLHNQTALLIKGAMLFRRNVTVTDVPYHLQH